MLDHMVYIKLTERCNLSCLHCFNNVVDINSDLNIDDLKTFLLSMSEYYYSINDEVALTIVFHGGEPLLTNIKVIKEVVDYLKRIFNFLKLTFSIQTNLTILNTDIISFLKEYNFHIGTSYTPMLRFTGEDSKHYVTWDNNLKLLTANNIPITIVVTLCKEYISTTSQEDLLKFLVSKNCNRLTIEPLVNTGAATDNWNSIGITQTEHDKWVAELADVYITKKYYLKIPKSFIIDKSLNFINNTRFSCTNRKCSSRVLTINANGTVGCCPDDSKVNTIGTITSKFSDIVNSKAKHQLIVKEHVKRLECLTCDFINVCIGGCMRQVGCYDGKLFFTVLSKHIKDNTEYLTIIENYARSKNN